MKFKACVWMAQIVVVAAATGCAVSAPPKVVPELQVRTLATERWQKLLSQKYEEAYQMASPGYRAVTPLDTYKTRKSSTPVKWLAAEVLRVDCEPERCVVRIKLRSKPAVPFPLSGEIESGIDEIWIKDGTKWWVHENI